MDTQNQGAAIPRKKSNRGILYLIPMFVVVFIVLVLPFIKSLFLALTKYNVLNPPKFDGFKNYVNLLINDDIFRIALKNTFNITFLSVLIVGTLTFTSSLLIRSAHKAAKYSVLLLFNLISFFTLAGGYTFLFSADPFGFINSRLIKAGITDSAILFLYDSNFIPLLQLLIIILAFFGPILTVLCLVKTYSVSDNKKVRILLPLESSLHVYLAVGLPVLLIPFCWNTFSSTFGFPSTGYAGHTITSHLVDYGNLRIEAGYASAISIISFLFMSVFLLVLFALSCCAMNIIAYIKRRNLSISSVFKSSKPKKTTAYITIGLLLLCALFLLLPLFIVFLNSFKSIMDLLTIPTKIIPSKLSLQSYKDLFSMDDFFFLKWLANMLVLPFLPALTVTLVTGISAYGISVFDFKARRTLYFAILLSFILLPTTVITATTSTLLFNHLLPLAFYAAFFSAAPLIGFVYLKSVINHARQYGQNLVPAVLKNCVPVVLITYVMCFIHPFVNTYLFYKPSFTIYFSRINSGIYAFTDTDSAAKIILVGITFVFIVLSAVTATAFFPCEGKTIVIPHCCDII